jgi:phospholipase/carboxylesterase
MERQRGTEEGRLRARPGRPRDPGAPGLHRLGAGGGLLYVPPGGAAGEARPLAVMFHGARGDARNGLAALMPLADEAGMLLLATDSADQTWDVMRGGYGPDVETLDRALAEAFGRVAVDPERLAVGGFSDGASYALSMGIMNGDLFTHVIAFSPGFMAPARREGAPRLYISHGTADAVLPIDACSRRIVPRVSRAGYDVTYHEFEGGHTVPADIAREAVEWFLVPTGEADA